jgi:hypothetical protein
LGQKFIPSLQGEIEQQKKYIYLGDFVAPGVKKTTKTCVRQKETAAFTPKREEILLMGCGPARQERQATNKKAANSNKGTANDEILWSSNRFIVS